MANTFAQWLRSARKATVDPTSLTGECYTQDRLAELLHISPEKLSSWETGRRKTVSPDEARDLAFVLGRSQREILDALGYEINEAGLTDRERQLIQIFQRWKDREDLQEQAIRILLALPPPQALRLPKSQQPARRRSAE